MEELEKLLAERSDKALGHVATIAEWQAAVESLCATVEAHLEPLRASGRLLIDYRIDLTTEEGLGTYKTKGLGLRFDGVPGVVTLQAKSALVVGVRLPGGEWRTGVRGRVDLSYGAIRVPLTQDRAAALRWSIGLDDALVALDEASLERAIKLLLGL